MKIYELRICHWAEERVKAIDYANDMTDPSRLFSRKEDAEKAFKKYIDDYVKESVEDREGPQMFSEPTPNIEWGRMNHKDHGWSTGVESCRCGAAIWLIEVE